MFLHPSWHALYFPEPRAAELYSFLVPRMSSHAEPSQNNFSEPGREMPRPHELLLPVPPQHRSGRTAMDGTLGGSPPGRISQRREGGACCALAPGQGRSRTGGEYVRCVWREGRSRVFVVVGILPRYSTSVHCSIIRTGLLVSVCCGRIVYAREIIFFPETAAHVAAATNHAAPRLCMLSMWACPCFTPRRPFCDLPSLNRICLERLTS